MAWWEQMVWKTINQIRQPTLQQQGPHGSHLAMSRINLALWLGMTIVCVYVCVFVLCGGTGHATHTHAHTRLVCVLGCVNLICVLGHTEALWKHVVLIIRPYLPLVCESDEETCFSDPAGRTIWKNSSGSSAFNGVPSSRAKSFQVSVWKTHSDDDKPHPALYNKPHLHFQLAPFIPKVVIRQSILSEQQGNVH